jgi:XTP/dITP diphosphohydrolase
VPAGGSGWGERLNQGAGNWRAWVLGLFVFVKEYVGRNCAVLVDHRAHADEAGPMVLFVAKIESGEQQGFPLWKVVLLAGILHVIDFGTCQAQILPHGFLECAHEGVATIFIAINRAGNIAFVGVGIRGVTERLLMHLQPLLAGKREQFRLCRLRKDRFWISRRIRNPATREGKSNDQGDASKDQKSCFHNNAGRSRRIRKQTHYSNNYNPHMKQRILLASGNAKKLAELRALCADLPIEILSPADLPRGLPDVVEDGATFEANARKKALAAAAVAREQLGEGVWALADDSGLCVDALGGAPGVFSARFASLDENFAPVEGMEDGNRADGENNARLLRELDRVVSEERGAAFHCVIVVARVTDSGVADGANSDGAGADVSGAGAAGAGAAGAAESKVLMVAEGSVRGRILEHADGEQGFGYDPLFWHEALGTTFARLAAEQKAAVSHRGQAVRKLKTMLIERLRLHD